PHHRPVYVDADGRVLAGRVEAVDEAEVGDGRPQHAALLGCRLLAAAGAPFVVVATTRRGHQGQGEGKSHQTNVLSSLAHQSSLPLASWSVTFVGARGSSCLPPSCDR